MCADSPFPPTSIQDGKASERLEFTQRRTSWQVPVSVDRVLNRKMIRMRTNRIPAIAFILPALLSVSTLGSFATATDAKPGVLPKR